MDELLNKRFGALVVAEVLGNNKAGNLKCKFVCDCGSIKFWPVWKVVRVGRRSCGCNSTRRKTPHRDVGQIGHYHWKQIQRGAKRGKSGRVLAFTISQEYAWGLFVEQKGRCKLTGLEISMSDSTASFDRIDSRKGYVQGNVQWVHRKVNVLKMDLPEWEFFEWCRLVAAHNSPKRGSTSGIRPYTPPPELEQPPIDVEKIDPFQLKELITKGALRVFPKERSDPGNAYLPAPKGRSRFHTETVVIANLRSINPETLNELWEAGAVKAVEVGFCSRAISGQDNLFRALLRNPYQSVLELLGAVLRGPAVAEPSSTKKFAIVSAVIKSIP